MRQVLLILTVAAATVYAQDVAQARRAVVHVEAVDRALLQFEELREKKAPIGEMRRLRIHQPYVLVVSGVAISANGEILTPALHPRAALRLKVTFHDGEQTEAEIIGTDPLSNLALIRAPVKNKPYLALSEVAPRKDELVGVVGHDARRIPLDVRGVVELERFPVNIRDLYGVTRQRKIPLASTFAVKPDSGRPDMGSACIDQAGRLVGVLVGDLPRINIHAVLPAARIARIVKDLRQHRRVIRSDFGCGFKQVSAVVSEQFQLPACACAVDWVHPRGPAAKAGLQRYDIITRLDGRTYPDPLLMGEAMSDVTPGKPVALEILRQGAKRTVRVTPIPLALDD
ncbi:MAG: S1C family serine protease [Planctomycetota bacterium]|jgi:S1-C subfamily serine protease